MDCDSRIEKLRRIAECARAQGSLELALDIERLAAASDTTLIELGYCSRCGASVASGSRLRLVLAASSHHAQDGCSVWRGVLCDQCADELRAWHGGLGGGLVLEGALWPPAARA